MLTKNSRNIEILAIIFLNFMGAFFDAISGKESIAIIAEIKIFSPSYGNNFPPHTVAELVSAYEAAGASAISVVTAPRPFRGSTELLKEAKLLTKLPLLRKDFITSTDAIDESEKLGASALLLIASNLIQSELLNLSDYARAKGIDVVVEVHTEEELEKVQKLMWADGSGNSAPGKLIIGINNRNLKNFSTDVNHAIKFLSLIPSHQAIIAESAFRKPEDLAPYKGKIDAALIGTAFLIDKNPQEPLTQFTAYARRSS